MAQMGHSWRHGTSRPIIGDILRVASAVGRNAAIGVLFWLTTPFAEPQGVPPVWLGRATLSIGLFDLASQIADRVVD